jgi:hypothetical protein
VWDELSERVWADEYDWTDDEGTWSGYVWGQALGYCESDFEELLDYSVETPELCWEACVATYGEMTYAIDFYADGDCYCASECLCLADDGDEEQFLMTSEWLDELPHLCSDEDSYFYEVESEMYSTMLFEMQA